MNAESVIKIVKYFGPWGLLALFIYLIVDNPDRAVKLKALIFYPFYRFFHWGTRQYLASEIGYSANSFFKQHVHYFLPSLPEIKIKIKWVEKADDPILKIDGTIILRIEETNDQTRNILNAAKVVLPTIVCPYLRNNIDDIFEKAIDLTLLRKLAVRIGRHAQPIYHKYFFLPEIENDERINELIKKLTILDDNGIFVPIFLEELILLNDIVFSKHANGNKTEEIVSLLEFLLSLAKRETSELIDTEYITNDFKIGLVLLAKTFKAESKGVTPYLQALAFDLNKGCDSIYIISYYWSGAFIYKILKALESDQRFIHVKIKNIKRGIDSKTDSKITAVTFLRKNTLLLDNSFQEKLAAIGLKEGDKVECTVIDVSIDGAVIDVCGLNGYIENQDCSWKSIDSCHEILKENSKKVFKIKSIDKDRQRINLTLKFDDENPWVLNPIPKLNDVIDVTIKYKRGTYYIGEYNRNIEIQLPFKEISWFNDMSNDELLNKTIRVKVIDINHTLNIITCSIRKTVTDPWPTIFKKYPIGSELRVEVVTYNQDIVKVKLPDDLLGFIPASSMVKAGFEYSDYMNTLTKGQKLDVVVTKVFMSRKTIRLELKRNMV